MSGLTPEQINLLLQEDAQQPRRGGGGKKVDPTTDRTYKGWFNLSMHHLCTSDCEHRTDPSNPTAEIKVEQAEDGTSIKTVEKIGNACWNPNCMDNVRDKATDRGVNIVYEVKGQMICRFCYLGGYLADATQG